MDNRIRVDGRRLVDATGQEVLLRGVGLGGWMTMENFITGYPATESQHRRALRRVLGPCRPWKTCPHGAPAARKAQSR